MQSLVRSLAHRNPFPHSTCAIPTIRPLLRPINMSTTSYSTSKPDISSNESSTLQTEAQLALPETAHNPTQLDMSNGSTTVKLEHLGPMVIGVDGTLSRISNWEGMTDGEKKATLRIIGKRNEERLKALRAKEGAD